MHTHDRVVKGSELNLLRYDMYLTNITRYIFEASGCAVLKIMAYQSKEELNTQFSICFNFHGILKRV
jgi:hypothetical protein